jgi:membrane protein involved in colicin uptake
MTISQGSKDFAAGLYEHVFGINPLDEVEKERQKAIQARQREVIEHQRAEEERQRATIEHQRAEEARQRATIEHQRAEEARQRAIIEHQRAEEERQRVNGIILYLHQEMHLLAPQIAEIVDKDQAYIEELLAKAATENGEN